MSSRRLFLLEPIHHQFGPPVRGTMAYRVQQQINLTGTAIGSMAQPLIVAKAGILWLTIAASVRLSQHL